MKHSVSHEQGVAIVSPQGKLDSFSAKGFEEELLGLIRAGGRKLIIDCAQLDYVSSAGLRIFYLVAHHLQEAGGKIVLCGVSPEVKRVFDIVDLSSEFLIVPGRADAMRQF